MLTKEEAHFATGMKVSEIEEITEIPGGYRVHTHDGQHIDLVEEAEEPAAADAGEAPAEEKKAAPSRGRKA